MVHGAHLRHLRRRKCACRRLGNLSALRQVLVQRHLHRRINRRAGALGVQHLSKSERLGGTGEAVGEGAFFFGVCLLLGLFAGIVNIFALHSAFRLAPLPICSL